MRVFQRRSWTVLPSVPVVSVLLVLLVGRLFLPGCAAGQEKEYEEWRQQQEQEYQAYLDEQDKAFLQFLEKQWTDVKIQTQVGSLIPDKPEEPPVVDGMEQDAPIVTSRGAGSVEGEDHGLEETARERPSMDRLRESSGSARDGPQKEQEEAKPPSLREEPRSTESAMEASLSFFGVETVIPYDSELTPSLDGEVGEESIRAYWRSMAEADYSPTLEAVQQTRQELGLSDWGYYLYVRDLGHQLYGTGTGSHGVGEAALWTWFMMMKSGYSVRVGYRQQEVFLMLPVDGQIFNRPQLRIDGQRYYLMVEEDSDGSLRTYEGQHASADRVLQLDERVLPTLEKSTQSRSVSFSYDSDRYTIEFDYNTAVLDYLRAYPNVHLEVLFEAGVSTEAESSLRDALRPHLDGRTTREALTFLLRFVQFATQYERDRENFGEERFLFPEESLAAAASDCEDRAVLFGYLARTLLDRQVVGLQWPGHVASAVNEGQGLKASAEDRTVSVDGTTYILADPTYIGSSLGMEMPFVEEKEPEVISFRQ